MSEKPTEKSASDSLIKTVIQGLILLVLISIAIANADAQTVEHSNPAWVTTWATSPSTLPGAQEDIAAVNDQTLRLITHTSIGGNALRLRLANTHGEGATRVGAITVALQSEGSSIRRGSTKAVKFGGSDAITIAPGAVVLSDPLAYEVPELSNLSISIYLPEQTGFLTAHRLSNQTNYISQTGNHTDSTDFAVASETQAWELLTAIDILPVEPVTTIVTAGDSITDGWGSTASENQRWTNHFARRLFNDNSTPRYAIANAGISGNRVTTEQSPTFGQNLQARFERDVLALSNVSHIILLQGINDIGMSASSGDLITAQEIIAGYKQIISRAHARGIKVYGGTLTPYKGAAYYTPEGELVRQQVNAFIRSGTSFDGVIDFEQATRDPNQPERILPSFTTDNLHPNDAGYKAMAEVVDLALFR